MVLFTEYSNAFISVLIFLARQTLTDYIDIITIPYQGLGLALDPGLSERIFAKNNHAMPSDGHQITLRSIIFSSSHHGQAC